MPGDQTSVITCGSCQPGGYGALTCRVGGADAKAWVDPEGGAVLCKVPNHLIVPDLSYDVIDGRGRLVCRGGGKSAADSAGAPADADGAPGCCGAARRAGPAAAGAPGCCGGAPAPSAAAAGGGPAGPAAALSTTAAPLAVAAAGSPRLPWLDRLLPLWIIAAMAGGILLGYFVPGVGEALAVAHIGEVSLPIALGLWIMMWPVLTKVRYELLATLLRRRSAAVNFAVSFGLNWVLGPALMTALAWACLPDLPAFRSGVILVGLARCIAMVLIWNEMALGDAEMCAVMVAFNSVLQIILYAPLSLFYLQVVSRGAAVDVGFWPVAKSVLLFLGVPLVAGVLLRVGLIATAGRRWFEDRFMPWFGPWALIGLLYTIVVLFASQGRPIITQLGSVARVAVPMLAYFVLMFVASMAAARALRMPYPYAATQAFTAASNNFELAIAVAVGTFGLRSPEALAATVGPLIEVPALLALVHASLWAKRRWWDAGARGAGAGGGAGEGCKDVGGADAR